MVVVKVPTAGTQPVTLLQKWATLLGNSLNQMDVTFYLLLLPDTLRIPAVQDNHKPKERTENIFDVISMLHKLKHTLQVGNLYGNLQFTKAQEPAYKFSFLRTPAETNMRAEQ